MPKCIYCNGTKFKEKTINPNRGIFFVCVGCRAYYEDLKTINKERENQIELARLRGESYYKQEP